VCGAIARRQHEYRLGEVELARNGLHCRSIEPVAVQHDRHGIAAETPAGEDIERDKTAAHAILFASSAEFRAWFPEA
jgi:hypothetical protein